MIVGIAPRAILCMSRRAADRRRCNHPSRIARDVDPIAGQAFAIMRGVEQAVEQLFVASGGGIARRVRPGRRGGSPMRSTGAPAASATLPGRRETEILFRHGATGRVNRCAARLCVSSREPLAGESAGTTLATTEAKRSGHLRLIYWRQTAASSQTRGAPFRLSTNAKNIS